MKFISCSQRLRIIKLFSGDEMTWSLDLGNPNRKEKLSSADIFFKEEMLIHLEFCSEDGASMAFQ